MNSLRSSRRQPFVEEKVAIFEQKRLVSDRWICQCFRLTSVQLNQLGQVISLPTHQRNSRQRDRRYARDVVSQSVVEWFVNGTRCSMKKKCLSSSIGFTIRKNHQKRNTLLVNNQWVQPVNIVQRSLLQCLYVDLWPLWEVQGTVCRA